MSKRVWRFDPSPTGLVRVLVSRVLPQISCDIDSSHTYIVIGETNRTLSQRFKEHTNLDKPTGVGDHCRVTGHSVSMKNTKVLTSESNWHKRKVKEAILYIRQRAPTMNRDTICLLSTIKLSRRNLRLSLRQHTWYQYVNKARRWRVETLYLLRHKAPTVS